jgi:hypothetical protein
MDIWNSAVAYPHIDFSCEPRALAPDLQNPTVYIRHKEYDYLFRTVEFFFEYSIFVNFPYKTTAI